ncbi:MAG: hypothetical protein AAGN15_13635 [Cyanobacteria bacterium J06581_3]
MSSVEQYIYELPARLKEVRKYMLGIFIGNLLPALFSFVDYTMREGHLPTKDSTAQFFVLYPDLALTGVLTVAITLVGVALDEGRAYWQRKFFVYTFVTYMFGAMYLYAALKATPISTQVAKIVYLTADVMLITYILGIALPALCVLTKVEE